jgi:hypothetical protein
MVQLHVLHHTHLLLCIIFVPEENLALSECYTVMLFVNAGLYMSDFFYVQHF